MTSGQGEGPKDRESFVFLVSLMPVHVLCVRWFVFLMAVHTRYHVADDFLSKTSLPPPTRFRSLKMTIPNRKKDLALGAFY